MAEDISLLWFRQDLRVSDNPALRAAVLRGAILPIYILDDDAARDAAMGGAARWWLYHSLKALNEKLDGHLHIYQGKASEIIMRLVTQHKIRCVFWNRCYEPWRIARDKEIKEKLLKSDIQVQSFNASLLWEPWEVLKNDGTPYKVFTPFYKNGCLNAKPPRDVIETPKDITYFKNGENAQSLESLGLIPKIKWYQKIADLWCVGEDAAQSKLSNFLDEGIRGYKEGRNFPAKNNVSRLSPHLHFGEISPNQIWYAAIHIAKNQDRDCFLSEIAWREFSHSLLYFNQDLPTENLQKKFNAFPWCNDAQALRAWQRGLTGYPIVDAGMRELWQTGYMHNRVRMIVGSFLVKNLLLDWRLGAQWFWDCLLDADLANNSASWQWVAGCGADAAPYFRIFNPVTQGQKFDPNGAYTRKYIPELARMPDKYLFNPWEAPDLILKHAGVTLGKTYPNPVVDLKSSRERALYAYQNMKS